MAWEGRRRSVKELLTEKRRGRLGEPGTGNEAVKTREGSCSFKREAREVRSPLDLARTHDVQVDARRSSRTFSREVLQAEKKEKGSDARKHQTPTRPFISTLRVQGSSSPLVLPFLLLKSIDRISMVSRLWRTQSSSLSQNDASRQTNESRRPTESSTRPTPSFFLPLSPPPLHPPKRAKSSINPAPSAIYLY